MKNITLGLLIYLSAAASLYSQNLNITFRSKITFQNTSLAGVWGYAAGGREYALVGASSVGLFIVDVTNPDSPSLVRHVNCPTSEIQTYSHYAYSTGGCVIDLQNLPNTNLLWHKYKINGQWMLSHTLHIDTTRGYLYPHFSDLVLDLNEDPYKPKYAGKVPPGSLIHDGYVDNDTFYAARIYLGEFHMIDMRDKSNPKLLGTQLTPTRRTHNTWLSSDRKILFTTDEDNDGYLATYDISDPTDIRFLDKFKTNPGSNSIPHNTSVIGNHAVTSWYTEGVSIVDATRPDNLVETGRFDTYSDSSNSYYRGCWGAYPFLPSGNILASNMNGELWILTPVYTRAAYLEGIIRDSITGNPIAGASIRFKGINSIDTELSSPNGQFKTGRPESGVARVVVEKFGYFSREIDVDLIQGQVTALEILLVPKQVVQVSGILVQENNLLPVPKGHVLILNDNFRAETKADADGRFYFDQIPGAAEYTIIAGSWGFQYKVLEKQFVTTGSHDNLTLAMKQGYRDDFIFDYGWTVEGTSVTGIWERTEPGKNYPINGINGIYDPQDIGDQYYITGIAENPFFDNGVKDGTMYLVSPPIILSQFTNPLVSFDFHFATPNDQTDTIQKLDFVWDTGTEEILIESVDKTPFNWRSISRRPLKGAVPLTDTIRFKVKAVEHPDIPDEHAYEAGFDYFRIEEGSLSFTTASDESVYLYPTPNPFRQSTRIHYTLPETGFQLCLADVTGRLLQVQQLEGTSGVVELGSELPPGIYFVQASLHGSGINTLKLIKSH